MAKSFKETLVSLVVPGGVVFCFALGFLRPHGLPASLETPISALPVIVLSFGLLFGWYLHSARLVLSLLLLAMVDRGLMLTWVGQAFGPSWSSDRVFFNITAMLLPLDLLALSLLKDEADSVVRGALRTGFVLLQPFLVLWLCYPEQRDLAEAFSTSYLPWVSTDWTPVPQVGLVVFAMAVALLLLRFFTNRDPMDAGTLWALAAVFVAYHCLPLGWRSTSFFSAAGLMLVLALVQSAHQRTYRDDLTGVAGRLAYDEAVGRLGKRYSIAVLGIDQLKSYTGVYGRSVTEQILRLVARKVQHVCQGGKVHRVSGEELTILFPHRLATETIVILEAVRKSVEGMSLRLHGRERVLEESKELDPKDGRHRLLPVTVSIGVAEKATDNATYGLVVKSAYRALYEAKGAGGNVVKRGLVSPEAERRPYHGAGRIVATGEY